MRLVLLCLFCALIACAHADLTSQIVAQVWAYEVSQNTMNATAAAMLFTADAEANVPLGQTQIVGNAKIQAFFSGFFGAIHYLIEDILGEIIVVGQYASASKLLRTALTPDCPVQLIANQFFQFDNSTDPPLISQFNVMWNVTSASCQYSQVITRAQRRALGLEQ